ncbi:aminoacylase-1-like isoform X1 [Ctenocephalides felis]|uniref:aminoacylase-1-like n=1 Tax=Ctenocephalides felis TaxID=7515 RepID=UPI000E6E3461|nr:aminoacylase-1-like [Ctenocephalides felis]XP_026470632.1 aminoacylase-1-like isoform X1 [Ctenocephalides felis]
MTSPDDALAVANFREYLQIPSVQPNIDYEPCVKFLQKQAASLNLPIQVHYCVPKKPIVIITWPGQDPTLPSVMLNSHMDVVPVFEDFWTYPPFSAHVDESGKIYARGSQDMKCVGIQFIEAVRRLKNEGVTLKRTIHISFVPDEEIGGHEGMGLFVKTREFQNLNVGVSLDEGMASANEIYPLFYGERSLWHVHIHCHGDPGHGSLILENTAGEKMRYIMDKFFDMRKEQEDILKQNPSYKLGDVTTINLTILKGGVQSNVIPEVLTAVFDIRITPSLDHKELEEKIRKWCKEAGKDVEIEFEQKEPLIANTELNESNKFWTAFKRATDEMGLVLEPQVFPAATDSRYIREIGLPAFGFSPMNNTPVLLHDHDEYLDTETFLRGITIFKKIIQNVSNAE